MNFWVILTKALQVIFLFLVLFNRISIHWTVLYTSINGNVMHWRVIQTMNSVSLRHFLKQHGDFLMVVLQVCAVIRSITNNFINLMLLLCIQLIWKRSSFNFCAQGIMNNSMFIGHTEKNSFKAFKAGLYSFQWNTQCWFFVFIFKF